MRAFMRVYPHFYPHFCFSRTENEGIYEGVPSLLPALFKQKESHMLFSNENEAIVYTMMMEIAQKDMYWS